MLVTGGRGVVGIPLTAELKSRGHEVWSCDLPHNHHDGYIRCDVRHLRQLEAIFSALDFDCVYHLAAEFGRHNGEDYYENLWTTNASGTKNVLACQRDQGFRLVFFSSSEVYGDYRGLMSEDVMDEHPIRQMNDYAMSKWVGEMQIENAEAMHGSETVRVRLFNVYGPGEYYSPYRSAVCVFVYCALTGRPYKVYVKHHRTSLYIDDAVRTLANIADRFLPGRVYNIGGTQYHNMEEVSNMILQHLGRADDMVEYVDAEPWTTGDKKVDVARAVAELDHEPQMVLEEGIAQTVAWMRQVYCDGEDRQTCRNRDESVI